MTADRPPPAWRASPVEILGQEDQSLPIVLASPHSGRIYPPELVMSSRLDAFSLRRSEDSFVDELFLGASALGAPLIRALFARAFVDPNREAFELDPRMFADPLPAYVNTRSARVAGGLGTIARVVAQGHEIYARKLRFTEAVQRINRCYRPYHAALSRLIEDTRRRFGVCLLLDCHSMPSAAGLPGGDGTAAPVDIVLGDCYGRSSDSAVVDFVERCLAERGYRVVRNAPYAGGYTTRHYGRPDNAVHAVQIEINRSLYMNEPTLTRRAALPRIAKDMAWMVAQLGTADWSHSLTTHDRSAAENAASAGDDPAADRLAPQTLRRRACAGPPDHIGDGSPPECV